MGIAIGAGTDIALSSADIVLMHSDLADVPAALDLSRATMRNIKQNLFWALFYNAICIPVAAGAFAWAGFSLNPMIAAAAMSVSSVCVVTNALRLRGWKPQRVSATPASMASKATSSPASANPASANEVTSGVSLSSGVPTGPNVSAVNSHPSTPPFQERRLRVEGMKCHKCAGRVRGALEAVPGVENAAVDLEGKQATVRLNDSVPDEMLVGAVIEKGFEAEMLP